MNKYRVSVAATAFGVIALSHGQTLGKTSFSSSMIASALSRFHGVKTTRAIATDTVAMAAKVEPPSTPLVVAKAAQPTVITAPADNPATGAKPGPTAVTAPAKPTVYVATDRVNPHELTQAEIDRLTYNLNVVSGGPLADPESVSVEMPEATEPSLDVAQTPKGTRNLQLKWVNEGYFDAGYEKLIGTFTTQMFRYGVRYGDDDLHAYIRNETIDTRGSGLPYPQAVVGTSVGLEARHWFPGNQMYALISIGDGIGGLNQGKTDVRYGSAGYTSWRNNKWFSDFYGELFYIALAGDTFLDWRLRSGTILKTYKDQSYLWDYVVGQFWVSGQTESGTENRAEFGPGIGYMFRNAISLNFEFRAGYAFRSGIDDEGHRLYWNPTLILAGGWYKGYP